MTNPLRDAREVCVEAAAGECWPRRLCPGAKQGVHYVDPAETGVRLAFRCAHCGVGVRSEHNYFHATVPVPLMVLEEP